jgi:hypothetical protein
MTEASIRASAPGQEQTTVDSSSRNLPRGLYKVRKQELYDEFFICMKCLHSALTPVSFYQELPGYLGSFPSGSPHAMRFIVENDFILGPDAYRFRHNWEVSGIGYRIQVHPHIHDDEPDALVVLEETGPEIFFLSADSDGAGLTRLAQQLCTAVERYAVNQKGRAGLIVGAALRRPEWELTFADELEHLERVKMLTRVEALGSLIDTDPEALARACPEEVAELIPELLERRVH